MTTNRVTLEQFESMPPESVDTLSSDQLAGLRELVDTEKARTKALDDKLKAATLDKMGDRMRLLFKAQNKDTGTVKFAAPDDPTLKIAAEITKKVEWDQAKLAGLWQEISEQWKEEPSQYIKVRYEIEERKFTAWPKSLQDKFAPARTVKGEAPKIKFEREEG